MLDASDTEHDDDDSSDDSDCGDDDECVPCLPMSDVAELGCAGWTH